MPNSFMFSKIGDPERRPVRFVDIDEQMCEDLGVHSDPEHYYHSWYDFVGLAVAVGKTWDDMRRIVHDDPVMLRIIDYLSTHYISDAWYSPKSAMDLHAQYLLDKDKD